MNTKDWIKKEGEKGLISEMMVTSRYTHVYLMSDEDILNSDGIKEFANDAFVSNSDAIDREGDIINGLDSRGQNADGDYIYEGFGRLGRITVLFHIGKNHVAVSLRKGFKER